MSELPPPWASVADIGQLGLETAATVVERLLTLTRLTLSPQAVGLPFPLLSATRDGVDARRMRAEAERLIDLYADWTRALVQAAVDAADGGRPAGEGLSLGPVEPGGSAEASVWLHLLEGPAAGMTTLRATDLVAHHGGAIPSAAVHFDPASLDTAKPRTSQQVVVGLTVPQGTAPGPYHGHILATGVPEVSLPLRVDVPEL
jgi:hypothetical protein